MGTHMRATIIILPLMIVAVIASGCGANTSNWEFASGGHPVWQDDKINYHPKFAGAWVYAEIECSVGWEQGFDGLKQHCNSEQMEDFIQDFIARLATSTSAPLSKMLCLSERDPVVSDIYAFSTLECGVHQE